MMMLSVMPLGLRLTKMILKYNGRKLQTNERHDETSEREGIELRKSKPDDFLHFEVST